MSPHLVSLICSGLALGELSIPMLFSKISDDDIQAWVGMATLGSTTLSIGLFVCVFLVARKHGSKSSRPQTAGYELANQEEVNQGLLLDEEDEEDDIMDDFEVSEVQFSCFLLET